MSDDIVRKQKEQKWKMWKPLINMEGVWMVKRWGMKGDTFSDDESKIGGEDSVSVCVYVCLCVWRQGGSEGAQVGD